MHQCSDLWRLLSSPDEWRKEMGPVLGRNLSDILRRARSLAVAAAKPSTASTAVAAAKPSAASTAVAAATFALTTTKTSVSRHHSRCGTKRV